MTKLNWEKASAGSRSLHNGTEVAVPQARRTKKLSITLTVEAPEDWRPTMIKKSVLHCLTKTHPLLKFSYGSPNKRRKP